MQRRRTRDHSEKVDLESLVGQIVGEDLRGGREVKIRGSFGAYTTFFKEKFINVPLTWVVHSVATD